MFGGAAGEVFTFRQNGSDLTGSVEGGGGGRGGGGETPGAIEDGKLDGANISFRAAGATYTGTVKGDTIELQRTGGFGMGRGRRPVPAEPTGPRPAIGPPPDGSDPSSGAFFGLTRGGAGGRRGQQTPAPIVLHRAKR